MLRSIQVKSLLNKTKRRDPWFLDDYTINPYSSCSFNCLFCYIRGSKYGIHMEEKLAVKSNALEVLEKQLDLRARKKQYGIIVLSSVTDPYLQVESDTKLTRNILELIRRYRFPVHIITRSDLVLRDLDIIEEINRESILPDDLSPELTSKAFITFSFSSLNSEFSRIFEPGAPLPEKRLTALKATLDVGFHSGVSLMPLLPYISDTGENLNQMFSVFKDIGIKYIFPASLTLFGDQSHDSKTLVMNAIRKHYPQHEDKYQKFFAEGNSMPNYYTDALRKKTDELCLTFGLRNRIL